MPSVRRGQTGPRWGGGAEDMAARHPWPEVPTLHPLAKHPAQQPGSLGPGSSWAAAAQTPLHPWLPSHWAAGGAAVSTAVLR